jgi:hypothetical protein
MANFMIVESLKKLSGTSKLLALLILLSFYLIFKIELLSDFFFYTSQIKAPGVDYYSLPKAYLNLLSGISMYATGTHQLFLAL